MPSIPQATDAEQCVPSAAEYDFANAIIEHVNRAAVSRHYCLALIEAHIAVGWGKCTRSLLRAIEARRNSLDDIQEIVDMAVSEMRDEDAELVSA